MPIDVVPEDPPLLETSNWTLVSRKLDPVPVENES
jgi:hypothetical protein